MRTLASIVLFVALGGYVYGAYYFFQQENWERYPFRVGVEDVEAVRHPDVSLAIVRRAFQDDNFSNPVWPHLENALSQAPAFYQSSFLVAAFHANRLEEPERTNRAFELSLRQYPANGRLQLTYAQWLFEWARRDPERAEDLRGRAADRLKQALALEGDLVANTLALMRQYRIETERWAEILPPTQDARRQLVRALDAAGERESARALLSTMLHEPEAKSFFSEAANTALRWRDSKLALEIVELWMSQLDESTQELNRVTALAVRAQLDSGAPDAAFDAFRAAMENMESRAASKSAQADLIATVAAEFLRRGQIVMAQSLYMRALTLAPRDIEANLGLARAHRRAGDPNAAMQQYRALLAIDAKHEAASQELEQLMTQELLR